MEIMNNRPKFNMPKQPSLEQLTSTLKNASKNTSVGPQEPNFMEFYARNFFKNFSTHSTIVFVDMFLSTVLSGSQAKKKRNLF